MSLLAPSLDQIPRGVLPCWELKLETGIQQTSWYDASALEYEFRFRPHENSPYF